VIVVASLVLFGAGVAVGWFAAKRGTDTTQPNTPGKPVVFYRADKDVLAPVPSWEEWRYPDSRPHNTSTGGGATVGEIEISGAARVVLVTPDDFEKVWAFYKDKFKLRDPGDASSSHRFEGGGNEQAVTVKIFDDVQAHTLEGPKSEGVQARGFSVQSLRYSLAGFVFRPKGGDATTIMLVYRPNTEFIGLLKDKLVKD
jgi:hypothetical protein